MLSSEHDRVNININSWSLKLPVLDLPTGPLLNDVTPHPWLCTK